MLSTVLIVLACVNGIASSLSLHRPSTNDVYAQSPDFDYNNDIQQMLTKLASDVQGVINVDEQIIDRLTKLKDEEALNTALVDEFLDHQFPDLRKRQANQSEEITDLGRRVEVLLLLTDDITTLNSTVAELERQANELARESSQLEAESQRLTKGGGSLGDRLTAVNARLAEQKRKLDSLEKQTSAFGVGLNRTIKLVENLTDVEDEEQGEQVVRALTTQTPLVRQVLNSDFIGVAPVLVYGFSKLRVSDDSQSYQLPDNYGSSGYNSSGTPYQNASIKFQIDVSYNSETNEITLSYFDISQGGWIVEELTVSVTIIRINNEIFEVERPSNPRY